MFVTALKVQKVKRSWNVINLIANYFTFFFFCCSVNFPHKSNT